MTEDQSPPQGDDLEDRWREDGPAEAGPIPGLSSAGDRARPRAQDTAHLNPDLLLPDKARQGTAPLPGSGTGMLPGSGPLLRQGTGTLPGSGPLPAGGTGMLAAEDEPEVVVPGVGKMRASDAARLQALREALAAEESSPPAIWRPWRVAYIPPTLLMLVGLLALAYLLFKRMALPPWWVVGGHGLIAVVAGLSWRPFGSLVAWRAFGVSLALPGIGPAIAWLSYMAERKKSNTLSDSYQEFVAFTPTWSAMRAVRNAEAALRGELSVRPWVEGLRFGDLTVKQVAAENLAKNAEGVAILRHALTDADGEVRLFASLALVKAEEQRTEALGQAREALAQAKRSGEALVASQLALGHQLAAYAASGLPLENDKAVLWGEALALASEVSMWPLSDEDLAQAYDLMALVAVRLQAPEASQCASKALGLGGPSEGRLQLAMEAHFQSGNLEGIGLLAKRLAEVSQVGDGADMARYWLKVQEQVSS